MNPRDSEISGFVRFHRMIRRGTSYGPMLAPGILEDDGAERGLAFVFVGANLEHQFEFVQSEWVNKGQFFRGPAGDKDPFVGANNGSDAFTIPQQPIRRRLQGLPAFVVTRGGEYFFSPVCAPCAGWPILRPEEHVCNSQRDSWMPGQGEVAFHRNDCERCPTIIPGPGP